MNNAELIDALRTDIREVEDDSVKTLSLMWRAADALEADERLLDLNTKRCEALRKQLREANESYNKRIAELEAQMPEEGEWIDGDARKVTARCSVCGHLRLGNGAKWANMYVPFCEICGARMRTVTDCHTLEEGER